MKKILVALMTAGLMVAGASFATAAPGPNGNNEKGLCTAYFNGQKKGHTEGDGPGPFGVLEDEAADDGSNENLEPEKQVSDDVFEFCNEFGIMGQPEQNGRFDCRDDESRTGDPRDSEGDGEIECIAND